MLVNAHLKHIIKEPITSRYSMILEAECEKTRNKFLQINIGRSEYESFECVLEKIEVPRPMTHDMVKDVFSLSDKLKLDKVLIDNYDDGIYYAKMVVQIDGSDVAIDCRPSDAVAVGIRLQVPIFVDANLFEQFGGEE